MLVTTVSLRSNFKLNTLRICSLMNFNFIKMQTLKLRLILGLDDLAHDVIKPYNMEPPANSLKKTNKQFNMIASVNNGICNYAEFCAMNRKSSNV